MNTIKRTNFNLKSKGIFFHSEFFETLKIRSTSLIFCILKPLLIFQIFFIAMTETDL